MNEIKQIYFLRCVDNTFLFNYPVASNKSECFSLIV